MTFTRLTSASADNRFSTLPSLDVTGTKVAFISNSDFFGQGTPSNQAEIWLYDLPTMQLTRVTTASGMHLLDYPVLSPNGQVVAFESDFDFLGQGVTTHEIWLYNTSTMSITRVTTATGNGARYSRNPSLNEAGTKVVFRSNNDFLGQGLPDTLSEIWLYDTTAMTITRVTTSENTRSSNHARLSADGSKIVFSSDSDFLNQGIPQGQYEIWLYDVAARSLTRLTVASASDRQSAYPHLNDDGTIVVFVSDSDFLGQGIPDDQFEVWLYDTTTMTYTRITSGSTSNPDNFMPVVSANGEKIVFSSDANLLGQANPSNQFEIWLYSLFDQPVYLPVILK
ncbi:MAG TPA: hypothetical protein VGD99_09730 [Anaerolineae bacterium]